MAFRQDKQENKLYISAYDRPVSVTIEYVPKYDDVADITSDYWIDIFSKNEYCTNKK